MSFLLFCAQFTAPIGIPWELGPLIYLEKMDMPTAAAFYSFSGSRDVPPPIPPNAVFQFGHSGGRPMRGITIPTMLIPRSKVEPTFVRRMFGIN